VKGRSANPGGRPKNLPVLTTAYAPDLTAADRRPIPNLVVEARKYSALAIDTLVELTKNKYTAPTRYNAATARRERMTSCLCFDARLETDSRWALARSVRALVTERDALKRKGGKVLSNSTRQTVDAAHVEALAQLSRSCGASTFKSGNVAVQLMYNRRSAARF
jgi:hypothetical protein